MCVALDENWTLLGSDAYKRQPVHEDVAPALAFQYRLDLDLTFKIPNFAPIGGWSSGPYGTAYSTSWSLEVSDRDKPLDDGLDDDEFGWITDDLDLDLPVQYRRTFRDYCLGTWTLQGVLHGLSAYNFAWWYGDESYQITKPANASMAPAWAFEADYTGQMDPDERLSVLIPEAGTDYASDEYTIMCTWYSPILFGPIPNNAEWDLRFRTSFDEYAWALWAKRHAGIGGTIDIDRDSILHGVRYESGKASVMEAIGGRRRYVTRKLSMPSGVQWGFPAHANDGRLVLLGWNGRKIVLAWSRDGGTTWDRALPVSGSGLPMGIRVGRDGELHGLRGGGQSIWYMRLGYDGTVRYQSKVRSGSVVSAVLEVSPYGALTVHASTGGKIEANRSSDGGITWRPLRSHALSGVLVDLRADRDGDRQALVARDGRAEYVNLNWLGLPRYRSPVAEMNLTGGGIAPRTDGQLLVQLLAGKDPSYRLSPDGGQTWARA
ncbi:MAG: hypothetical protein GF320_02470 [Armatimonadia bacterium]|nr:hypothetical protein [Armatimonadia bacterium]